MNEERQEIQDDDIDQYFEGIIDIDDPLLHSDFDTDDCLVANNQDKGEQKQILNKRNPNDAPSAVVINALNPACLLDCDFC